MKDEEKEEFFSIGRASKISGLSTQTIRSYVDQGKIKSVRAPSGQRRIYKHHFEEMFNTKIATEEVLLDERINYVYTRVSTKKQSEDLDRQLEFIRSKNPIYSTYTTLQDIGSGINFKRKGLQILLDGCLKKNIGEIVIAHRDRLCRFGFELIEELVKKSGGTIKVVDCEEDNHRSSEQELSEDLLAIVQIYSCKQMGRRRYTVKKPSDQTESNAEPDRNT